MALIAVLEFGDNNIKRYSKQYLVSNCRFCLIAPTMRSAQIRMQNAIG